MCLARIYFCFVNFVSTAQTATYSSTGNLEKKLSIICFMIVHNSVETLSLYVGKRYDVNIDTA